MGDVIIMEKSKSSSGIIAAVIAIVIIGGGLLWFMNRDSGKTDTQANNQTQQTETTPAEEVAKPDIVVIATQTESLSTLVAAVKAAQLVDTLQGEGPYTVFAPTNTAFEALPAGTLDTLLKPENIDQLKSILTYHVVSGKVMAQDLTDGQVITTVQGGTLTVSIMDGKVYLTDAKGNKVMVEKADVNADNGVVHVINGVLLPS
jgi:uncharacterized surface protein with fasciclin (FAS1) repeats